MPSTPPIIRSVTLDDFEPSLALRLEALRDHPDAFGSDYAELLNDLQRWRQRIEGAVKGIDEHLFVAQHDGALVGMTGTYRDKGAKCQHAMNLWGVYVRPAFRGTGTGARLVERALDWCAAYRGITIVRLTVSTHNAAAIRCYESAGFVASGTIPKFICVDGTYYDELMMSRETK